MRRFFFFFFACIAALPGMAHADCANPSAPAGRVRYFTDQSMLVYCDGTNWIAMGRKAAAALNEANMPTNGLVGHWKLNESGGTTASDSAGSNDGTLTNMDPATDWVAGQVNNALDFDGTDDYVSVSSSANFDSAGTWSAWIKTDGNWGVDGGSNGTGTKGTAAIITRHDGGNSYNGIIVGMSGSNLYVQIKDNSNNKACQLSGGSGLTDNSWHHILLVFSKTSGGTTEIYVDGQLKKTCTNAVTWNFNSQPLRIGDSADDWWEEFEGSIDDVRIYNRALSADEVGCLAGINSCLNVGLVGHWKLDESSGTTASDSAGSNDGTLTNMDPATDWVAGKLSNALDFDGTDDYVEIPSSAAFDAEGTWSAWIKTDGNWGVDGGSGGTSAKGTAAVLTRHDSGTNSGILFGLSSGRVFVVLKNTSNDACVFNGGSGLTDNQWHHILLVFSKANGGSNAIYVDGQLKNTCTNNVAWSFNSQPLRIADSMDGWWEEFAGEIDDVRVYNRALSANEISILYTCGAPGYIQYNADDHVMQFCSGLGIHAMGLVGTNPGTANLAGHWKLDESSGTTASDSAGSNDGTLTNMDPATDWVAGKLSNALEFDGTDDYVGVADNATLDLTDAITIAAWIKGDSWANTEANFIVAKNDQDGQERRNYELKVSTGGKPSFGFSDAGIAGYAAANTVFSTGQWYHIVGTYDRSQIKVYVNGALDKSVAETDPMTPNNNVLSIGRAVRNSTNDYGEWDGRIDDARIYNRALSAAEIYWLYQQRDYLSIPSDGLVGHWGLDESSGTTASDSAGSNDGTLTNMDPATDWVAGQVNNALDFDGTDRVEILDNPSLEPSQITISAWVYRRSTTQQYHSIVNKESWSDRSGYYFGDWDGASGISLPITQILHSPLGLQGQDEITATL